jgi:hypothetical protein
MPSRKQRRRREKEKRHEYEVVYIDAEGKELPPEEVEDEPARSATRNGRNKPVRPARGGRVPQPPSWRRAARRAAIFGPIMFIAIWLLESKAAPAARVAVATFYTLAFIPLFFLMDRLTYRTYHRRLARDAERRKSR